MTPPEKHRKFAVFFAICFSSIFNLASAEQNLTVDQAPHRYLRAFIVDYEAGRFADAISRLPEADLLKKQVDEPTQSTLSLLEVRAYLEAGLKQSEAFEKLKALGIRTPRAELINLLGWMKMLGIGTNADTKDGFLLLSEAQKLDSELPTVLPKEEPDHERATIKFMGSGKEPALSSNFGALLIRGLPNFGYTVSINMKPFNKGSKRFDDALIPRFKMTRETFVAAPPGSYQVDLVISGNPLAFAFPCRSTIPIFLGLWPKALYVLDIEFRPGDFCTHHPEEKLSQSFFARLPEQSPVRMTADFYLISTKKMTSPDFLSEEELTAIRKNLANEFMKRLDTLDNLFLDDLKVQVQALENEYGKKALLQEQIRRSGDGGEEDIACKKRGFRPSTAAYEKCYKDQTTARLKREKAATEAADLQKSIAEREANDPFADAKRRCLSIGLQPKTEAFGKCVLELSK